MGLSLQWILLVVTLAYLHTGDGVELTFELAEASRECFYEDVVQGDSLTLEYQVVTGGSYDVDVTVQEPSGFFVYKQARSQFDSQTFSTSVNGTFAICFSNDFSAFSHKLVYMDLQVVSTDPSVTGTHDHPTVMTQMEASAQEIGDSLRAVIDHQTHHRLREAQGRKRAEELSERIFWWSLMETLAILFVTISQVFIVKKFFSYRNPSPYVRP